MDDFKYNEHKYILEKTPEGSLPHGPCEDPTPDIEGLEATREGYGNTLDAFIDAGALSKMHTWGSYRNSIKNSQTETAEHQIWDGPL